MVPLRSVLLSCRARDWSFNSIECPSSRFGTSVNIRRWQNEATTLSVNTVHQSLSDTASQPARTDQYKLDRMLGRPHRRDKYLTPARNEILIPWSSSTQPSHYTNWGITALHDMALDWNIQFKTSYLYPPLCFISDLELHSLHQFYQKLMLKCTELNITNTNPPTIIPNIPQKHLYTKLTKIIPLFYISLQHFIFNFISSFANCTIESLLSKSILKVYLQSEWEKLQLQLFT